MEQEIVDLLQQILVNQFYIIQLNKWLLAGLIIITVIVLVTIFIKALEYLFFSHI